MTIVVDTAQQRKFRDLLKRIPEPASIRFGNTVMEAASRELPMPHVARIISLNQAHATLLHCCNQLARFQQEAPRQPSTAPSSPVPDESRANERRRFRQWLARWDGAFTAFLSAARTSMTSEDLSQSRVLKANQIACNIVASDARPGTLEFDAYEQDFQAIIDLATAVLQLRQRTLGSPTQSAGVLSPEVSPVTSGLDVRDPLCILLATCRKQLLRTRANDLLLRFFPG
ncbi:hypothetical protein B0A50_00061 [Salinomyces thailandicus]|uniref:Uncharacterized protein n=1 Tax=Salinomyces thailandicus TaxID=706561 RepID=A0A4U0UEX0_9PEZI|nr:hypothetical protein B0A50_00061 [Salinomyces thailandica]